RVAARVHEGSWPQEGALRQQLPDDSTGRVPRGGRRARSRRGGAAALPRPQCDARVSPGGAMTVTYRFPGAVLTERRHPVPLTHAAPDGGPRPACPGRVGAPDGRGRPYLVFLQGGPGFEAARPTSPPSGWMKRALADFRVLLLDQRGTGRSSPVGS